MCLFLSLILSSSLFTGRRWKSGLTPCSCVVCLYATTLMWRALATDNMGKVCPQIFRKTPADQRAAVTPPGFSGTEAILTPQRLTGAARETAQVQEMSQQKEQLLVLDALFPNYMREVMSWNSYRTLKSANPLHLKTSSQHLIKNKFTSWGLRFHFLIIPYNNHGLKCGMFGRFLAKYKRPLLIWINMVIPSLAFPATFAW